MPRGASTGVRLTSTSSVPPSRRCVVSAPTSWAGASTRRCGTGKIPTSSPPSTARARVRRGVEGAAEDRRLVDAGCRARAEHHVAAGDLVEEVARMRDDDAAGDIAVGGATLAATLAAADSSTSTAASCIRSCSAGAPRSIRGASIRRASNSSRATGGPAASRRCATAWCGPALSACGGRGPAGVPTAGGSGGMRRRHPKCKGCRATRRCDARPGGVSPRPPCSSGRGALGEVAMAWGARGAVWGGPDRRAARRGRACPGDAHPRHPKCKGCRATRRCDARPGGVSPRPPCSSGYGWDAAGERSPGPAAAGVRAGRK
jgi:hypothetical protein